MSRQGNSSTSSWSFTSPYGREPTDAVRLVGTVAAILSIGAGVIHVSAAGDHTNLPVMFVGFMVVATLQVALGVLLAWRRPSKLLIAAGLALMLGSIGVWLVSRTEGLPFLEGGHTEPIGVKDGVTVLFELASIPALLLLLSSELARVSLPSPRLASRTLAVVGVGCFALLVPAMLLGGGEHHTHEEAVALGIHEDDHGEGDAVSHAGSPRHIDEAGEHTKAEEHAADHGDHASADGAEGTSHAHNEFVTTPLGATHEHTAGDSPGGTPKHHTDDEGHDDAGGQDHRDRPHGDGRRGGDHGDGHGDGDHDEDPNGDPPITVSYEPEPSICVAPGGTNICFP